MSSVPRLPFANDRLIAAVDGRLAVCGGEELRDVEDFERYFIPELDPENWGLRNELQNRNDCQANAATTGLEVIEYRTRKYKGDLSRMFVYQQCEKIDNSIGRDAGTSIQSGVKLLTEVGAPLESEYPYTQYTRNARQLEQWTTPEILASAATRKIISAIAAPAWQQMLFNVVVHGRPVHWGTWWPLRMDQQRVVRQYRGAHGSGGHATAIVWATKTSTGELLAKVANSHGDKFFWINERAYEEMRDRNNSPFGAYQLIGEESPPLADWLGKSYLW